MSRRRSVRVAVTDGAGGPSAPNDANDPNDPNDASDPSGGDGASPNDPKAPAIPMAAPKCGVPKPPGTASPNSGDPSPNSDGAICARGMRPSERGLNPPWRHRVGSVWQASSPQPAAMVLRSKELPRWRPPQERTFACLSPLTFLDGANRLGARKRADVSYRMARAGPRYGLPCRTEKSSASVNRVHPLFRSHNRASAPAA